jgi:hypothetical protein
VEVLTWHMHVFGCTEVAAAPQLPLRFVPQASKLLLLEFFNSSCSISEGLLHLLGLNRLWWPGRTSDDLLL